MVAKLQYLIFRHNAKSCSVENFYCTEGAKISTVSILPEVILRSKIAALQNMVLRWNVNLSQTFTFSDDTEHTQHSFLTFTEQTFTLTILPKMLMIRTFQRSVDHVSFDFWNLIKIKPLRTKTGNSKSNCKSSGHKIWSIFWQTVMCSASESSKWFSFENSGRWTLQIILKTRKQYHTEAFENPVHDGRIDEAKRSCQLNWRLRTL